MKKVNPQVLDTDSPALLFLIYLFQRNSLFGVKMLIRFARSLSLLICAVFFMYACTDKGAEKTPAKQPGAVTQSTSTDTSSQAETETGSSAAPHKKTTTLALPERTNNAWEMKPFELPDTDGNNHTLSDWKGKVIMLNFWASWCAPCQFEIPRFVGFQKKYADKGLQIVGVGLDEAKKLKNVERSLGMNYPTMVISQYEGAALLEKWGNDQQIVPYTVVIAKDGTIVYIHRGGMEDDDFNTYVLPLLENG